MSRRPLVYLALGVLAALPLLRLPVAAAQQEPKKDLTELQGAGGAAVNRKPLFGNSYALIIGINGYPNLPQRLWLRYAVADALSLQRELIRSYGFPAENVRVLTDAEATEKNIRKALSSLANLQKVQPEDRLLVYFSGHGQDVQLPGKEGKMGFLLPYDADVDLNKLDNPAPFLESCLQMDTVWSYLEASAAKHVLLIADACYSGFLAKSRSVKDEELSDVALQSLAKQRARQVITAGRSGEQSFELPELGHGAFTGKLLDALRQRAEQPGQVFTATQLFSSVDAGVRNVTQGRQSPQFASYGTAEGQFLFVTAGGAPGPGDVQVGRDQDDTVARAFVKTDPPGARIYLNGVEVRGMRTPATVPVSLGGEKTKTVTITVDLDGVRRSSQVALVTGKLQEVPLLRLEGVGSLARLPDPAPRPSSNPERGERLPGDDLATDFSARANPNGPWTFGYLAPGAQPLVSTFRPFRSNIDNGEQYLCHWRPEEHKRETRLSVVYNPTAKPIQVNPALVWPPYALTLAPGDDGRYCAARWTARSAGTYLISGSFEAFEPGGASGDVRVLHNGEALFIAFITGHGPSSARSFSLTASVRAGDTIDFVVGRGPNGNAFGDSFVTNARIVRQAP